MRTSPDGATDPPSDGWNLDVALARDAEAVEDCARGVGAIDGELNEGGGMMKRMIHAKDVGDEVQCRGLFDR